MVKEDTVEPLDFCGLGTGKKEIEDHHDAVGDGLDLVSRVFTSHSSFF